LFFLSGFALNVNKRISNDSSETVYLSESRRHPIPEAASAPVSHETGKPAVADQVAKATNARLRAAASELPSFQPNGQSAIWMSRTSAAKHKAALRLTQQGESRLRSGDPQRALSLFEKALGLEASPYVYISLARAHYMLGHYAESLNFIEVAESWLNQDSSGVPEVTAFKAKIPGSGLTEQKFPDGSEVEEAGIAG
jgi:tetratricopeptide (TPR) repeat protein